MTTRTITSREQTPRQRIMTSHSFGKLTGNYREIREAISQHGQRGDEKLRQQGSLARAVLVFLKTNPHRQDLPQHSLHSIVELERPTDDSREILRAASYVLDRVFLERIAYLKAGVMPLDLIDANREPRS